MALDWTCRHAVRLLLTALLAQAAPPAGKPPAGAAPGKDPYARVQEARKALDAGQYDRVLRIVDGLLKEYPRSPSSHLLRALALDELSRWDEARKSYEAALRITPKDAQIQAR